MRHSTDPDHVIAVSTIVARHRSARQAAWVGVFWGLGHTITVFAVGSGIIVLGLVIPPRVGLSMEFSVGLMLIVLGIMNLSTFRGIRAQEPGIHSHAHAHGEYVHTHPHSHEPEKHPHGPEQTPLHWSDRHFGDLTFYQAIRPLVIGTVHGLAGSTAVALLVLAAIRETTGALLYLAMFGAGTILGMVLCTVLIALPLTQAGKRSAAFQHGFRIVSGAISLAFGLFLAYKIGVVEGLLLGAE